MFRFSYQDYILKEEENSLVTFSPERINADTITGTQFFYKEGRFIKAVDTEMTLESDTERNEHFITFEGKRVYASGYYNPDVEAFVSL